MIILVDAEKSFAQFNNFIYGLKKNTQEIKIPQPDEKKKNDTECALMKVIQLLCRQQIS